MNSLRDTLKALTDASADAIARAIAGLQRDAQRERELRDAEHRARLAEMDVLVAEVRNLERCLADRLESLKDGDPGPEGERGERGPAGADVDMDAVRSLIEEGVAAAVAAIPPAQAGKDADPAVIAEMVAAAVAAQPPAPAGKDADPEMVRQMVDDAVAKAVADIPPAAPGKDADPNMIVEMVSAAVAALPPAPAGKDADPEVIRQLVSEAVAKLPAPERGEKGDQGERGAPGLLPIAEQWVDKVHYTGAVVTLEGATYQAIRDTGRAPPHDDWRCLARAGRDGADGRTFRICGTYVEGADHHALDVVVLNGASFVAKHDEPGPCPGEGWQMIAAQGKRGAPGERGMGTKGERGAPGPAVVSMSTDDEGLVTLTNADGSSVTCDLYPVLSKLAR